MTDTTQVAEVLDRLGFTEHPEHPVHDTVEALSHNGPFVVHGSWQKDGVIVHVEQNTAPEQFNTPDGQTITHPSYQFPAVLVIEDTNGGGRVAVSLSDLEAFERVLNGDRDFDENK